MGITERNLKKLTAGKKNIKYESLLLVSVTRAIYKNYFGLEEKNDDINNFEIGKTINISTFKEGEHVDIIGTTKGKGFQGGVKRHHFKTQDATHGNSLAHRAPGSIGQCQDPGRVFKGKKMAGRMGGVKRTAKNLEVLHVDEDKNLILVKGAVPGHKDGLVKIKAAKKLKRVEG